MDGHGRPLPLSGVALVPLGVLCFRAGRFDEARQHVQTGLELCRKAGLYAHIIGLGDQALARLQFATGQPDEALQTLRDARQTALALGKPFIAAGMAAVEAELLVRQGAVVAAGAWAASAGIGPKDPLPPWYEQPYVTLAQVLLAQGRVGEAQGLLSRLEALLAPAGRYGRLLSVRLLQAQSAGSSAQAAAFLREAEELAAVEGYAIEHSDRGAPSRPQPLVELLSERELELLGLIAAGLANDELAARLYISLNTVKWHLQNLYGKLGVTSRTQAVAKARELGLLEG